MKIVFMGTPDFAAGSLEALIVAGHDIISVVTQPDKAKGRSKELQFSPVKKCAVEHNIPVMQPRRIKTPEAMEELRALGGDVYIVAAFGQILSQEILDMPQYGSINIHASLLPKYRGASPIQNAIINGEAVTGITIIQMDAGIDTGDMLFKKEVPIERGDNFETLHDKLMISGGEAIVEALELLENGKLLPEKQQDELSCYAPLIDKSMGKIDFSQDAYAIELKVRGMNPWPSAYTSYQNKQMKIWEAVAEDTDCGEYVAGQICEVAKEYIAVATGNGILKIYSLQLEGKKRMSTHDFLLGVKVTVGEELIS